MPYFTHGETKNKLILLYIADRAPAILTCAQLYRTAILNTEMEYFAFEEALGELSEDGLRRLLQAIKHLSMKVTGHAKPDMAQCTSGGVDTACVEPSTMESKLVPGFYFCGEVLDVDATTGGFNLQIAWSTGMLAGRKAAKQEA